MYLAQPFPLLSVEALKATLSGRACPQPLSFTLSSWILCGQQDRSSKPGRAQGLISKS